MMSRENSEFPNPRSIILVQVHDHIDQDVQYIYVYFQVFFFVLFCLFSFCTADNLFVIRLYQNCFENS